MNEQCPGKIKRSMRVFVRDGAFDDFTAKIAQVTLNVTPVDESCAFYELDGSLEDLFTALTASDAIVVVLQQAPAKLLTN